MLDAIALGEILGVAGGQKIHGPICQPIASCIFQPLQQYGCAAVELTTLRGLSDPIVRAAERLDLLQDLGSFVLFPGHCQ
jgi:hypothetical protein